jgi:YVTN family beta-propeller protein
MSRVPRSAAIARRLAVVAAVAIVVALFGAASPGKASGLSPTTTLPSPCCGGMAIDPVGHHIFVSGGSGSDSIYVLDLAGNLLQTISGEPVARGMVVDPAHHTLYAALGASGQISIIDTTTLTETARVSAGRDTQPTTPVIAGGKLWVMGNGPVSMNLDGTGIKDAPFGGTLIDASRDGNLVALSDSGYSPASIGVMEVATNTPRAVSRAWNPGGGASNGQDIAFDASGANVLFASGYPYNLQQYDTLTLASSYQYPHSYDGVNGFLGYGAQAAASPGGAYVAFGSYDGGQDAYIYREDSQTLLASFSLGGGTGMLAFSPDGSKLYSIGGGAVYVLPNPAGPDTPVSISSAPANVTLATDASFDFSSTDNAVTFKCSLDGAMAVACSSPVSYSSLAAGTHTFQVQAFKGGLLVGSNGRAWVEEALNTKLSGGPSATTYATQASFTFTSDDDNATFECNFDSGGWSACSSPVSLSQLGIGSHTFQVRAEDGGSVDPTGGATQTWAVFAPDTKIISAPTDPTYSSNATFTFFSHATGATFQCSLDGADWSACTSPVSYSGLAWGSHSFSVKATSDAGYTDPVGATKSWTIVKIGNITTQITQGPSGTTRHTSASFSFTSNDPTATFACALDGGVLAPCTSPTTYTGLDSSTHAFSVFAFEGDTADATGATRIWSIDTTSPPVASLQVPPAIATGNAALLDASGSHDPYDAPIVDYKWDLGSGAFTLDTGVYPTTNATFASVGPLTIRVQVTNSLGQTAIATQVVNVELGPPPGVVGFSINNGDYATSSPNVTLDVIWPLFAQNMLISNDGGFGPSGSTTTVPVAASAPWTLAVGGSERLPHIVYVRFPDSAFPTVTFTDDIILDTTTPVVSTAKKAGSAAGGYKVKMVAAEKLSGISQAQFSTTKSKGTTIVLTSPSKPGITKLSKTLIVPMSSAPKWTRVRSAAGKWSAWHAVN